jgi:hypothetical protein
LAIVIDRKSGIYEREQLKDDKKVLRPTIWMREGALSAPPPTTTANS